MTNEQALSKIESRFKTLVGLKPEQDITAFPLPMKKSLQADTNKDKSKEFGEVFTPLWLADRMIKKVKWSDPYARSLDLCAGYGQFSVRLLRHHLNKYPDFSPVKWLKENHCFSEIQYGSCYKLLATFGTKINLFIGDSTYLGKLPKDARGIWTWVEKAECWVGITRCVMDILVPDQEKKQWIAEGLFVKKMTKLVERLNKGYETMELNAKDVAEQMKRDTAMSLHVFTALKDHQKEMKAWQNVMTPDKVVLDLLGTVEAIEEYKTILVLFNAEIVVWLITKFKIDPKRIVFGTDLVDETTAKIVRSIYGVQFKTFKDVEDIRKVFGGMNFDVCFSNPPYSGKKTPNIDLTIVQGLVDDGTLERSISREYVLVHPATWLLDMKGKVPAFNELKATLNRKIKTANLFNGNKVFGIFLFVPCMVYHIDVSYDGDTTVDYCGDKFSAASIADITKFGSSWNGIVKPLYKRVLRACEEKGSIWDHRIKAETKGKKACQFARIRGNVSKNVAQLTSDDFYTLMMVDSNECKGIRKPLDERGGPAMEFDTDAELDHYLAYLKTDFARMCLALHKNKSDTDCGEMATIPWLDFTQSWDDEKLFKHFDVNKETQDYIRKYLPDYYGIRKSNTNAAA